MENNKYYDGTKLLSLKDIDGNTPEIYICTSNRTAGKTTYFNRLVVNKFLRGEGKFIVLYRFSYELDDVANKFFKDIQELFFPQYEMTSQRKMQGIYHELFLNDKPCGYAIAINSADQIKKNSHLFSDAQRIIFDEFQSETNHYCSDEVTKFISIHTSVARGQGKQVRYVPVYMIGNPVTILNPYYVKLNLCNKLKNAKFIRGEGFVVEQGYNETASSAQKESAFNRAFAQDDYVEYASEGLYLNDNQAFVDKLEGKNSYLVTLKYNGVDYAIREYSELGLIYCDKHADETFKFKITVTTDDHNVNYVMLKKNDAFISTLRYYFQRGCFRFKDLQCKEAVLKSLSY